jgi:hypothetical protein
VFRVFGIFLFKVRVSHLDGQASYMYHKLCPLTIIQHNLPSEKAELETYYSYVDIYIYTCVHTCRYIHKWHAFQYRCFEISANMTDCNLLD